MKEHFQLKGDLIDRIGPCRNANKTNLDNGKDARERDLAKVKSESSRDIQLRINMVNIVKTPKKRNSMVGNVPIVKGEIHEQKTHDQLNPAWKNK